MPRPIFDDYDGDDDQKPVKEYITEYTPAAVSEEKPPVVSLLPNSFRGGRAYVPELRSLIQQPQGRTTAQIDAEEQARKSSYGLTVPAAPFIKREPTDDHSLADRLVQKEEDEEEVMTAEERAMQELVDPTEVKTEYTIQRIGGNELFTKVTDHPDMSTLDEYDAIPVESFGLAMLRGMGYDPAVEAAKQKKEEKALRRPDFLGIGATPRPEDSKSAVDLGKKKHEIRKEARTYVPLVKVSKKTGEIVNENAAVQNGKEGQRETKDTSMTTSRQSEERVSSESRHHRKRSRSRDHYSSHKSSRRSEKSDDRDGRDSNYSSSSRSNRRKYDDYADDRRERTRERSHSPKRDSHRHSSRSYRDR